MNWNARSREFRSGTRKVFPRIVTSTSFSYGRKTSAISSASLSDIRIPPAFKLKQAFAESNQNHLDVLNSPMAEAKRREKIERNPGCCLKRRTDPCGEICRIAAGQFDAVKDRIVRQGSA